MIDNVSIYDDLDYFGVDELLKTVRIYKLILCLSVIIIILIIITFKINCNYFPAIFCRTEN